MTLRPIHFTRRVCLPAAMLFALLGTGGCTRWSKEFFNPENFNPDHYRDQRAVEIDHRLEKPTSIVKNPF